MAQKKLWFALLQGYQALPRLRRLNELQELWWIRALNYCADHLTDGVLTEREARTLLDHTGWVLDGEEQSWPRTRDALLASGLLELHPDGYALHDYLDHNPSRAEVEARHVERSTAGKAGAAARWKRAVDGDSHGRSYGSTDGKSMAHEHEHARSSNSRGSQAAPLDGEPKAKGRGTRLPADWQPSAEQLAKARTAVPSVDLKQETEAFRDWALAAAGAVAVKRDWEAAWRGWMRRRHAENLERGWKPTGGAPAQLSDARARQQAEIRRARLEAFLRPRGVTVADWERHERAGDAAWMERVRAMAPMEGLEGL